MIASHGELLAGLEALGASMSVEELGHQRVERT
jgi:hypothetical protein